MHCLQVSDFVFLAFNLGRFFRNIPMGLCILLFLGIIAAVVGIVYVWNRFREVAGIEEPASGGEEDLEEKLQGRREKILETREQKLDEIPQGRVENNDLSPATLRIRNRVEEILPDREFTIGKAHENSLVISGRGISRRHAKIRPQKTGYVLFDLVSSSGTFLNGKRITQSMLHEGDRIRIGPERLVFGPESGKKKSGW